MIGQTSRNTMLGVVPSLIYAWHVGAFAGQSLFFALGAVVLTYAILRDRRRRVTATVLEWGRLTVARGDQTATFDLADIEDLRLVEGEDFADVQIALAIPCAFGAHLHFAIAPKSEWTDGKNDFVDCLFLRHRHYREHQPRIEQIKDRDG